MPEASRPHAPHVHAAAPATATATLHGPPPRDGFWSDLALWRHAAHNTWHCLLGCLLGDFAVMAILPLRWPGVPTPVRFGLAIAAGVTSSMRLETLGYWRAWIPSAAGGATRLAPGPPAALRSVLRHRRCARDPAQ